MTSLDYQTTTVTTNMKLDVRVRNRCADRRHKHNWTKVEWFLPGVYQHVVTTYHLSDGDTIDMPSIQRTDGYRLPTLTPNDGLAYSDLMRSRKPLDDDEGSEESIMALMHQEQIGAQDLLAILTKVAVAASLKPTDIQSIMKSYVEESDEN